MKFDYTKALSIYVLISTMLAWPRLQLTEDTEEGGMVMAGETMAGETMAGETWPVKPWPVNHGR